MTSTPSNIRRKVRAPLAKTVATVARPAAEAASALQLAKDIAAKHLPPSDIVIDEIAKADIPAPEPVKPKRQRKAKGEKSKKMKRANRLMALIQRDVGVSIAELMVEFGC